MNHDDSALQVHVDSVRVLDDKLLVLDNNLLVRVGLPLDIVNKSLRKWYGGVFTLFL